MHNTNHHTLHIHITSSSNLHQSKISPFGIAFRYHLSEPTSSLFSGLFVLLSLFQPFLPCTKRLRRVTTSHRYRVYVCIWRGELPCLMNVAPPIITYCTIQGWLTGLPVSQPEAETFKKIHSRIKNENKKKNRKK